MSLEENIKNEIRLWSKEALEKPNENYNNMPACPFAKRAWADDRVGFIFKKDESFDVYDFLHRVKQLSFLLVSARLKSARKSRQNRGDFEAG